MWEKMEERGIRFTEISADEMSHLFAFLLFIRYADEPGNPEAGEKALKKYKCQVCHSIDSQGGSVGPDLQRWAGFVNPVVWAQKMWGHALEMESEMRARKIAWPRFSGEELVDIVAYIRSHAGAEAREYLEPGSPSRGEKLFESRGCLECHRFGAKAAAGPNLQDSDLPDTLAGIAAQMWNHAPKMQAEIRKRGSQAVEIEAQEMADIIAYLMTRRYFLSQGDPVAGRKVFVEKSCMLCHSVGNVGGNVGPKLTTVKGVSSSVIMGHAMWRYGPRMLDQMAERGIPWPHFEGQEMSDLIAFLNQSATEVSE
jgi:cytochrome c2